MKWQPMTMEEQLRLGSQIDERSDSNIAADAIAMSSINLPFYPDTRLISIANRQPALGNKYCIEHGGEAYPLNGLDDIQPRCDERYNAAPTAENAADYFRFAHFFTSRGRKYPVIESPADVHLDGKVTPAEQRVVDLLKPVEAKVDDSGAVNVRAYTLERSTGVINEETYRLTPGQPLALLNSQNTGVILPDHEFVRTFLYVGGTAADSSRAANDHPKPAA